MILARIRSIFKRAELPSEPLDALRVAGFQPNTECGMAELIGPSGETVGYFTQWYCAAWCKDHTEWSWKPLE